MKTILRRAFPVTLAICGGLVCAAPSFVAANAQAAAAPATATRLLGTVTAIDGNNVTIKTDAGAESVITVGSDTRMLRTEPGQKSLSGATPIHVQDLAVGDRVLARATPAADGKTYTASLLIAMSHTDIAQRQQQEREDWQKNGVGGIVKSVDPAAGVVTITAAGGNDILTIHATPATIVRRYAPNSVQFAQSKPSTLDQIHPGDQLRARGTRTGGEVTAKAIVVGSFRNIAGTVKSVDKSADTITVTDLATKKPVTIHFTSDSQVRKLPPQMAEMLAARFRRSGNTGNDAAEKAASARRASTRQPSAGEGAQQGEQLGQVLQRAPSIQISALHKGDAVMIVATQGTPNAATAITLLAGVEPLLRASASASQGVFSASWNLSGNGGEQAAPQ